MASHQDDLSIYGFPKDDPAASIAAWQDEVRVAAVPSRPKPAYQPAFSTHHLRVQMGGGCSILLQ